MLMIPVLISIVLGIIELSNYLTFSLRASNISREIANAAFRDCSVLTQASLTTCLQTSADRVRDHANFIFNNFNTLGKVIVSSYQATPNPVLADQRTAGLGVYASHYDINKIDLNVLTTHQQVVVGEVVYPYTPITPAGLFLNLFQGNPVIYEVTFY